MMQLATPAITHAPATVCMQLRKVCSDPDLLENGIPDSKAIKVKRSSSAAVTKREASQGITVGDGPGATGFNQGSNIAAEINARTALRICTKDSCRDKGQIMGILV